MRKIVLSLAAVGTALAFATPASAQYYPQPQPQPYAYNGYGQNGYNNGNAYGRQGAELQFTCKVNSRGQVSELKIDRNRVSYRGY